MTSSDSRLDILQFNANHCIRAIDQLKIDTMEIKQRITCIQEPYYLKNKVVGFSIKDNVIAFETKPRVAMVIHDNFCDAFPITVARDLLVVRCNTENQTFVLANVYIPPDDDITPWLQIITEVVEQHKSEKLILLGDFNAKNPSWGGQRLDQRGEELADLFISLELVWINDRNSSPTFASPNGESWIDLTIVNGHTLGHISDWEVLDTPSGSDHSYIKITAFGNRCPVKRLTKTGEIKVIDKLIKDRWLRDMSSRPLVSKNHLEHVIRTFYDKIEELTEIYSKVVTYRANEVKWWTPQLSIERKKIRALRRRYQNCKNNNRDHFKKSYYEAHKDYKSNIKDAKQSSFKEFCGVIHGNNVFTLPYKIALNKLKRPVVLCPLVLPDGVRTKSLAETVRFILTTLFEEDDPNSDSAHETNVRLMSLEDINTINDIPFTSAEVDAVLAKLKLTTAPGIDNIKTFFLRTIYNNFKELFLKIFNACLEFGYFPAEWKEGKIILLKKTDRVDSPSGYRPICLNSIFGKVLEKLINNRLYHFLHSKKLLHENQFGFTHRKSAVSALYKIKTKLEDVKREGKGAILVSLDIKGAFNSLWAPVVINKLRENNCPRNLFNLVRDFLTNRKMSYLTKSEKITIGSVKGCPQGSPLSPLLFNVVIADLLQQRFENNITIQAFADDVTLIVTGKSRKELEDNANRALNLIKEWGDEKRLSFNPAKCEVLDIGDRYKKRVPTIKLGGRNLTHVNSLKILGVVFDSKLTFTAHAEYLKSKITQSTQALGMFSGVNWGIKGTQFRDIYIRGIERAITYAAPVWWKNTNNSHLARKLQSVQRTPLLKITKAYRTVSNINLNILSNIMPIALTLDKEAASFHLFQRNSDHTILGTTWETEKIQKLLDPWDTHPAEKTAVSFFKKAPSTAQLNIFTDGSVCNQTVGAAFIILDESEKSNKKAMYKLEKHATIYDAEMIAILKSLEYISTFKNSTTFNLFTDSLSTLQALANPHNNHPIIQLIKNTIKTIRTMHSINLMHVKGHTGVEGNELADKLANKARTHGEPVALPMGKNYVKKEIKIQLFKEWDQRWKEEGQNSELSTWIPSIYDIPDNFPANFYVSQVVTNHGRLPYYLYRVKLSPDQNCFCGRQCVNFLHYLNECPLLKPLAEQVYSLLPGKVTTVTDKDKINILKNQKILKLIGEMLNLIGAKLGTLERRGLT